jgi:hypothetical protein
MVRVGAGCDDDGWVAAVRSGTTVLFPCLSLKQTVCVPTGSCNSIFGAEHCVKVSPSTRCVTATSCLDIFNVNLI